MYSNTLLLFAHNSLNICSMKLCQLNKQHPDDVHRIFIAFIVMQGYIKHHIMFCYRKKLKNICNIYIFMTMKNSSKRT
jgi:hypothetical protein